MLDLKFIRENLQLVKDGCKKKYCDIDFDALQEFDSKRRSLIQETEELKCTQNKANEEMARLKKEKQDFKHKIDELREVSKRIKSLDSELAEVNEKLNYILERIPNLPHDSVPVGGEENNEKVREWGTKREFDFKPKDHLELAEALGYIDMSRATKITGRAFILYKGLGARLERALINFMLDMHTEKHGYTEVFPPFLVNRDSMYGTGQIPKLEDDMYRLPEEDFFLIPTAEVPVTNIHRNDVLNEEDLPVKYAAYTPCFRREAGSYGKDTRGLSRVHQFDKVEMVKFVKPEDSFNELETLLNDAEEILQKLNIPYRIVTLASGDLSFAASKCYDIEIWAPGSDKWFEVSSCSNFCDFQARRANIKYKDKETGKKRLVHTLNGSGVALARLVIAILENYQNEDGSISWPEALKPYLRIK